MRNAVVARLYELANSLDDIFLLTGDLGYGVLTEFARQFPGRFINAGISEQNMTSVAAGMALEGKKVFTYSIGNFPTLRCLEQIRNDCAYHNANVKIISVGGGFAYGSLGMSHHTTEDLAILRALPNVLVFAPGDLTEAEEIVHLAYNSPGTCYIRLGKGGEARIHPQGITLQVGKALLLKKGCNVALFSAGSILEEVVRAAAILEQIGIYPTVVSFPTVKPLDEDIITGIAAEVKIIFTIEEHNILGGFGSGVAEVLSEMEIERKARLVRIGLNDTYSSEIGNQNYLREYYGLSAEKIAERVKSNYSRL